MTIHSNPSAGLDGVAAAVTALSHVDGEKGELIVAGSRIGELADRTDFEGLAARLWSAAAARPVDATEAGRRLARGRVAAFERLPAILPATAGLPMVDAFRVAVAAVAPVEGLDAEATIVGAMPVLAAALVRQAEDKAPVAPDPGLGHAADMLRMMRGAAASDEEAKALDVYLVTVADHGMNASTFAARVVASTQANLFMAVTAGLLGLYRPPPGGAPGPAARLAGPHPRPARQDPPVRHPPR